MHELKIVVPFVDKVHPRTVEALNQHALNYEFDETPRVVNLQYIDLTDDPVHGYPKLLQRLWREGETFVIIEQDIEIGPSTVFDFRACNHEYCANPYPWTTDVGPALGCTRFRDSFIAQFPDAALEATRLGVPARQLDTVFQRQTLWARYKQQPHVHSEVIHHNEAKALLPEASPIPIEILPAF